MSRWDEIDAIRAVVAMPFLAKLLKPEHFACTRLRAAFEHLAAGHSVWTMEGPAREALIADDLWLTDHASSTDVKRLRDSATWELRKAALRRALVACEQWDSAEYERAVAMLSKPR